MTRTTSIDPGVELAMAETMAAELDNYLLGEKLFQQVIVQTPRGTRLPKLTPGMLMERLRRLEWTRGELSSADQQRLDQVQETVRTILERYPSRWRERIRKELNSRLNSWNWFMQDCRRGDPRCRDNYASEVQARDRIQLLVNELGSDEESRAERIRIEKLDRDLRARFEPGPFVWDESLARFYPQDSYWWLYGRPRAKER